MKGKKIALWVSSKAFNCSIVLIELRRGKIRVNCIVSNRWITRDKHKEHHQQKQQQQRLMEMASCNNCSLKEKEQVYTAARDGNLLYLKVSVAGWPRHCTNHKPASTRWISIEPWILTFFVSLLSVCLFWFDFFPSVERLNFFLYFGIDLGSPVGRRSLRCPTMWIHPSTHHPHTLARPSTNDKKRFFSLLSSSSPPEIRALGCVRDWMLFYYQRTRLSPSACFQFLCVDFFFARVFEGFSQICLFFFAARGWFMKIDNDLSGALLMLLSSTCHDVAEWRKGTGRQSIGRAELWNF